MGQQAEEGRLAFEQFFLANSRSLVCQAYALTGNLQEAQDLAQDALTQAWRHWAELRSYADPAAWTRRVLYRLAVSRWRRLRLAQRYERSVALADVPAPEVTHVEVAKAISRLPAGQRRTLVLHDVVGLTTDEIAAELGVPAGTARGWLHRARHAVAAELKFEEQGPPAEAGEVVKAEEKEA